MNYTLNKFHLKSKGKPRKIKTGIYDGAHVAGRERERCVCAPSADRDDHILGILFVFSKKK